MMEIKDLKKMITVANKENDVHKASAMYLKVIAETQLIIIDELNYLSAHRKGD